MTGIYAYTLQDQGLGCLVADDRMMPDCTRVDKVHVLAGRFAIAVYGPDITEQAIGIVGHFEGRAGHSPPSDTEELAERLARSLLAVAEALYPKYEADVRSGKLDAQKWRVVKANSAGVVVLDASRNELYRIDLGSPFPPQHLAKPLVARLQDGVIHLEAVAKQLERRGTKALPAVDPKKPAEPLFSLIRAHAQQSQAIGSPGAAAIVRDGELTTSTVFRDERDFVAEVVRDRVHGFHITVVDSGPRQPETKTESGS